MTRDPNADLPDELDGRLRAAGERFRAATTAPARVDLQAAVDAPPRRRTGRLTPVLLAAAAVVLVAGVAIAVAQLAGHGGNGHGAAGTPATTSAALPLAGTYWTLSRYVDAQGNSSSPVVAAYLRIDVAHAAAALDANDGCNALGGPVAIGRDTLRFGNLISTAMGCPNPDLGVEIAAVHAVIATGTAGYAIDGDRLTLRRGDARLDYIGTAASSTAPASTAPASTAPADPAALSEHAWRLQGIQRTSGDTVSSEAPDGSYVLTFDAAGHFRLTEPCAVMVGSYEASGPDLLFSGQRSVMRQCTRGQANQGPVVQSLFSRATWSLDTAAGVLTLRGGDTTLVFRG